MKVALIGGRGFVGSALRHALDAHGGHDVTCVDRSNYDSARPREYELLINSAMPSGRFWAKQNPHEDFLETVEKTHRLIHDWQWQKFVQISSVSARAQLDTIYGRHKAAAEALCDLSNSMVVRLGPMYGPSLAKGVLIDMLHDRQVFVSGDSRYGFAPLDWVARRIVESIGETGIREFGASNSVRLADVRDAIGSTSGFTGPVDIQEFDLRNDDAPAAESVLDFLFERQSRLSAE